MGWLERPDQSARWHSPRRPAGALVRRFPRCQALACLLGAHSRLRLGGFHKAYGWAQASPAAKQSNASNPVLLQSLLNAFYSAEHLIVSSLGLEDCLPRSLALFVFLRSYRLPVSHRIGVRRYPFRAHAWVEYDGRALLAPVVYGTSPRPGSAAAQPDFTPIARID